MTDHNEGTGGPTPTGPFGDPEPRGGHGSGEVGPGRWRSVVGTVTARIRAPGILRGAVIVGAAVAMVATGIGIQQALDSRVVLSAASTSSEPSEGDPVGSSSPADPAQPASGGTESSSPDVTPPTLAAGDEAIAPATAVHIPRLKLDVSLIDLHVLPDGSMSVPQDAKDVGWWGEGPHPGAAGAALVAGHVDSKTGPAVFFRLKEMVVGDLVTVDRADHTSVVFKVVSKATYTRSDFPDDVVYRVTGKPSLHLVTCDAFDASIGHYSANLVVFADLVSSGPTGATG